MGSLSFSLSLSLSHTHITNVSLVIDGMELEVNTNHPASGGTVLMNDLVIEVALNSSGFIVREHPGYSPR